MLSDHLQQRLRDAGYPRKSFSLGSIMKELKDDLFRLTRDTQFTAESRNGAMGFGQSWEEALANLYLALRV